MFDQEAAENKHQTKEDNNTPAKVNEVSFDLGEP